MKLIPTKQLTTQDEFADKSTQRTLDIEIFRHNPLDENTKPRLDTFHVEESESMTLFILLNEIRETLDPTLQFDFVCRAGICGSCAMLVNGKPQLACRTLTKDLPNKIRLAPLPGFELIGDLSVNTGKWMRGMSERIQSWIHTNTEEDINSLEEKMQPDTAEAIYELERCIECGCCIAACGTAQMRKDFIGAVGLVQIARFAADPRDQRKTQDYYDVIGNDNGVFGCMTLLGCEDMCPKNLPLAQQIAYMRRTLAFAK